MSIRTCKLVSVHKSWCPGTHSLLSPQSKMLGFSLSLESFHPLFRSDILKRQSLGHAFPRTDQVRSQESSCVCYVAVFLCDTACIMQQAWIYNLLLTQVIWKMTIKETLFFWRLVSLSLLSTLLYKHSGCEHYFKIYYPGIYCSPEEMVSS